MYAPPPGSMMYEMLRECEWRRKLTVAGFRVIDEPVSIGVR